jgi:hypothetical protein
VRQIAATTKTTAPYCSIDLRSQFFIEEGPTGFENSQQGP